MHARAHTHTHMRAHASRRTMLLGAMMSVDETLMCSFQILKPAEKQLGPNSGSQHH